jgi:hypothetical protein
MAFVGDDLPTLMRAQAPRAGQRKNTVRFYFEPEPFTGMTDVISVQSVGVWGDNYFVIEAETEDEAMEKLLDLLEKRVWEGQVRPATEYEAKKFEEEQDEAKKCHESVAEIAAAMRVKVVGK